MDLFHNLLVKDMGPSLLSALPTHAASDLEISMLIFFLQIFKF